MARQRYYIAIDLKSFYASVECIQRGLDPLTTNLLVADASRTEKTICLAVSPSLKSYGIPGRARLFEAVQKVREANALRRTKAPGHEFTGKSWDARSLNADPSLEIDYITAPPRMAYYMETSARIYEIYLKYVAPEDIHVYSIDEVFMDVTPYLKTSGLTPHDFARQIIQDVLKYSGITATAGIGTNLYLCKVAMDIVAKHVEPDKDGVRIAELDEQKYKELLWDHAQKLIAYMESLDDKTHDQMNDLHSLFGGVCALCELQQALPGKIETDIPLKLVLDRRPFI